VTEQVAADAVVDPGRQHPVRLPRSLLPTTAIKVRAALRRGFSQRRSWSGLLPKVFSRASPQ
jgi:hypothetical protein